MGVDRHIPRQGPADDTHPGTNEVLARPAMSPDAVELYKYAVANSAWTESEAMGCLGLDGERLESAISVLRSRCLLRRSLDSQRPWDPVAPETAALDLLVDDEIRLRREQILIHQAREELLSLQPTYADALRQRPTDDAVDVVSWSDGTAAHLLTRYAQQAVEEIRLIGSGPVFDENWLSFFPARKEQQDGPSIRFVLDHTTLHKQLDQRHLDLLADCGAAVRTARMTALNMILFDRSLAVLPASPDGGVSVARNSAVVDSLAAAFDLFWTTAQPVSPLDGADIGIRDRLRLDILRLLRAGYKDEFIARKVGLSVRTCRRHIAEIMEKLGANSRFQAGALAERLACYGDSDFQLDGIS
jgi:DNA-binding CsgD family transcriptional regulator